MKIQVRIYSTDAEGEEVSYWYIHKEIHRMCLPQIGSHLSSDAAHFEVDWADQSLSAEEGQVHCNGLLPDVLSTYMEGNWEIAHPDQFENDTEAQEFLKKLKNTHRS